MSDKMREEFEMWATSCEMCTYLDGVEYRYQSTEWAWKAWQASRAALVVELPCSIWCSPAYQEAINDVKEALDDAGVGYE